MPRIPPGVRFRPGRLLPLRRRPRGAPFFWRSVDDGKERRPSYRTLRYWELVLQSRGIPHVLVRCGRYDVLYVPPLAEGVAREELEGFSAESETPPPLRTLPPHPAGNWAVLALLGLLCWHGLRMGWWGASWGPDSPELWMHAGALDVMRLRVYHEWYRVVTALTLHADSRHLLGNVAFGAVFLTLLCRRVGLGLGAFLTVAGGAAGNVCNALFRPPSFVSLGFSTALFASVGALSGSLALETHQRRGKALVPLAAGAALLAMLGTEGERVDYGAHVWGLLAGFGLGAVAQYRCNRRKIPLSEQWLLGLGTLAGTVLCWRLAF